MRMDARFFLYNGKYIIGFINIFLKEKENGTACNLFPQKCKACHAYCFLKMIPLR